LRPRLCTGASACALSLWGGVHTDVGIIGQTDFGYTGQRNYASIGLMDYNARFYSPRLGRFTQPDTLIPGAGDPQNFNRYSYVSNNPMGFADPSGHREEKTEDTVTQPEPESPIEEKETRVPVLVELATKQGDIPAWKPPISTDGGGGGDDDSDSDNEGTNNSLEVCLVNTEKDEWIEVADELDTAKTFTVDMYDTFYKMAKSPANIELPTILDLPLTYVINYNMALARCTENCYLDPILNAIAMTAFSAMGDDIIGAVIVE